jgi:N-acetylglucosaminyldiphosphoundecaprenol N-acetyl-beta-D-mannosaminyltransferase
MEKVSNLVRNIKNHPATLPVILWIFLWSGYGTTIGRLLIPGFPQGLVDMAHGIRSLFPILSAVFALVYLLSKKYKLGNHFFLTPVGLLLLYAIIGVISSIFSTHAFEALYWALMYGSVIVVLLLVIDDRSPLQRLVYVMNLNWLIGGALALGLTVFFFINPSVLHSITFNFLVCMQRPFEHIGDIGAGMESLGVALSRPTGLGRYAGIVALVTLWRFLATSAKTEKRKKIFWLISFLVFLGILLFAKGKTEVLAFMVAMGALLYFGRKITMSSIAAFVLIGLFAAFSLLLNIPCTNNTAVLVAYFQSLVPDSHVSSVSGNPAITQQPAPAITGAVQPSQNSLPSPITTLKQNLAPIISNLPLPDSIKNSIAPASPDQAPAVNPQPKPQPEPQVPSELLTNIRKFSTLSGRTTGVWPEAIDLFMTNPVWGYGFQADRFFLEGQHAHNTILHTLVQTGLLGTIPFAIACIIILWMMMRLLKNNRIDAKEKIILVEVAGVLIFIFVRGLTESFAFYSADWLFLAPLIFYIYISYRRYSGQTGIGQSITVSENKIDMVSMNDTMHLMSGWIGQAPGKARWIVVTGMHGIVQSSKNPKFKQMLRAADAFVPDGISLILMGQLRGFNITKRISGTDLMSAFFVQAQTNGWSSYFYGDTPETLEALKIKLLVTYPNLKIAGMYSPPFKQLTSEEDNQIVQMINDAKPDVIWVGLGLPKQETWIFDHKDRLNAKVVVGTGAAFKFLAGKVNRAPSWVGGFGFEWLWRFFQEPKKMWRRVLLDGPVFLWIVFWDLLKH